MKLENLTVGPGEVIKNALKKLDQGGERVLFVVDEGMHLLGLVTDSDIRRFILREGSLHDPLSNCMNPSPTMLTESFDPEEARTIMLASRREIIPIVGDDRTLLGYVTWAELFGKDQRTQEPIDVPVVIMAGGKGTRLDPFTKILPKPLIPVGDQPIVEVIMDRFGAHGVREFYLTVNYKGEMIKSYFDNVASDYLISYVWEKQFTGTAGSLRLLPSSVGETFFVSNCDIVVKANYASILRFHRESKNLVTVVGSIQHYRVPYGILEYEKGGRLKKIVEKPEYDMVINTGLYILEHRALASIPDAEGVFHMTDLIHKLMAHGDNVGVYPVSESSYMDIGQWEEYRKTVGKLFPD
jgi:dTDP-glucose pyrophosphorylase